VLTKEVPDKKRKKKDKMDKTEKGRDGKDKERSKVKDSMTMCRSGMIQCARSS